MDQNKTTMTKKTKHKIPISVWSRRNKCYHTVESKSKLLARIKIRRREQKIDDGPDTARLEVTKFVQEAVKKAREDVVSSLEGIYQETIDSLWASG